MKHKKILIAISIILAAGALAFGVVSSRLARGGPSPQIPNPTFIQQQGRDGKPVQRARNLSLQPEAFNMARRLGSRFGATKREVSIAVGTLTIGSDQRQVQTKRVQTDSGEQVEVKIAGSSDTLTWDASSGSLSSGRQANGSDRDVIERLVFDSPDQFVLGQLRGSSYFMVARNVRPAGAGDNYQGPLWNIVRVSDPELDEARRLQSRWRLYYLNTTSGLIERVESVVDGQRIVAEFSVWTNIAGEQVPGRIVWTSQGRTLMEYQLANFSHAQQ